MCIRETEKKTIANIMQKRAICNNVYIFLKHMFSASKIHCWLAYPKSLSIVLTECLISFHFSDVNQLSPNLFKLLSKSR